ncbi:MAG: ATP-dependent Zn protease [Synechococcaceae cyanobacterium RL_1_2]|nr:ATP-dependent Zn protease [Synechococcaceae cyanobacterium RL_1_2]
MIHLAPSIPAVTTFAILALVTFDTLGWDNRGLSLFLDIFTSSEERLRITRHEAGHFLVAYLLHIPIDNYALSAWAALRQGKNGLGGVQCNFATVGATSNRQELPLLLDRFATVCMAGMAAEELWYETAAGERNDLVQLAEAYQQFGVNPGNLGLKERWAKIQAKTLIEQHINLYECLVKVMAEGASVADCITAIEKERDDKSRSLIAMD